MVARDVGVKRNRPIMKLLIAEKVLANGDYRGQELLQQCVGCLLIVVSASFRLGSLIFGYGSG